MNGSYMSFHFEKPTRASQMLSPKTTKKKAINESKKEGNWQSCWYNCNLISTRECFLNKCYEGDTERNWPAFKINLLFKNALAKKVDQWYHLTFEKWYGIFRESANTTYLASIRITEKPKVHEQLSFVSLVKFVTKRNHQFYQAIWRTTTKSIWELYNKFCHKHSNVVSCGSLPSSLFIFIMHPRRIWSCATTNSIYLFTGKCNQGII